MELGQNKKKINYFFRERFYKSTKSAEKFILYLKIKAPVSVQSFILNT
jgi:hypothetical protein